MTANALKWDVRQRLAMLEATALWEGRVTTGALTGLFGISRGQASKDFALYHQLAPANIVYDARQKAYFPADDFQPLLIHGTADEYLRLMEAGSALGRAIALPIMPSTVNVDVIRAPERKLDLHILRLVNQAIREQRVMTVMYQSMTRASRSIRIEPHTLVYNGFRWHVRAYSQDHEEYRDFVLARMIATPELNGPGSHTLDEDRDWNTWESWTLAPHPGLSDAQQTVIAEDYGMIDHQLRLNVRKALSLYYLRMLHLDEPKESQSARIDQVVLVRRKL